MAKPTLADKLRDYGGTGIAGASMPPDLATALASKGIMLGAPGAPVASQPLPPGTVVATPAMEKKLHKLGARFVAGAGAAPSEKAPPTNAQTGVGIMQGIQEGLVKAGAVAPPPEVTPSAELAPSPAMVARPAVPMLAGAGAPVERWRVGPQVRAAYATADESARRAVNQNEALGEAGAEREQEVYRQAAEDQAIAHAEGERAEKDRRAVERSYQEQYDALADEVGREKIDEGKAWGDKSTAQQIGQVVHDALRGFLIGAGAGDIGGTMEEQVNRSIEVQKANLANRRSAVEAKRGALAMALQRFGDERTAEAAARASLADKLKAEVGTLAAQSKSDQVKANANTAMAALDQQKAQNLAAMMAYGAAPGAGAGGAYGTVKMGDDQFIPLGDGIGIMARSAHEGEQLRAKQAAAAGIVSNLQALAALEKNASYADKINPLSDYNEKRAEYIADTNTKKTVFEGQGAQSKGDEAISRAANGVVGGVHRLKDNSELIGNAIQTINKNVDIALKGQGGMVVQQVYGRDAHGQIVPRYLPVQGQYGGAPASGPPPATFRPAGAPKGGK